MTAGYLKQAKPLIVPRPDFTSDYRQNRNPELLQLIFSEKSEIISQESSLFAVEISRMSLWKLNWWDSSDISISGPGPGVHHHQRQEETVQLQQLQRDKRNHVKSVQWTKMCKYYLSGLSMKNNQTTEQWRSFLASLAPIKLLSRYKQPQ